jgi:glycolate oxidase iron-sulfur subunit
MTDKNLLRDLDYSVVQKCIHCGFCLPSCPTYDATKRESSSPRGRIAMMRAVADGKLEVSAAFADEMYFCLGCLACQTACPAGVDFAHMLEMGRAESERVGALANPKRNFVRSFALKWLFEKPSRLRCVARLLRLDQSLGFSAAIAKFLPKRLREFCEMQPKICAKFSFELIGEVEMPTARPAVAPYRVGLVTGCVQDVAFSDVNRDTVNVLLANGCEVVTPRAQVCCGSLLAHNGELELAKELARQNLDAFDVERLDAIIINAAGCGSHMKHYDRLLADDKRYAERAKIWSRKSRDISEFLVEIGFRKPMPREGSRTTVTYHEACHLVHGQKVSAQPRELLASLPNCDLVELPEATWCCGSAGIYTITQPEMAWQLQQRKIEKILATGANIVATGNPGCVIQIVSGLKARGSDVRVAHPVTLLAEAYRAEHSGCDGARPSS